jgi:lysophospholipase L1-like esterase
MRRRVVAVALLVGSLALEGCSGVAATPSSSAVEATPTAITGQWREAAVGIQIVGIGDSVLAARHCSCPGSLTQYARLVGAHERTRTFVVNAADDGPATSASLLGEVRNWPTLRTDLGLAQQVVIMVGANDFTPIFPVVAAGAAAGTAYPPVAERLRDNVVQIVRAIQALPGPVRTVLICGYWNDFKDGAIANRVYTPEERLAAASATEYTNAALRAAASAGGGIFVPVKEAFDSRGADPTALLDRDGNHPNPEGNDVIAAAILHAQEGAPTT